MSRYLFILLTVFLADPAWAGRLQIEGVRVWAAPDNTRVVLDTSRAADYRTMTLVKPHRLVVDLPDTEPAPLDVQAAAQDRYLRGVRVGIRNGVDLRIVLDLKQPVRARVFRLPPNRHYGHRLVVDLLALAENLPAPGPAARAPERGPDALRDVVVAVDAGHGGDDPGAIGSHGTREKDVVLGISSKLVQRINAQPGLRAVPIRKGDYYMPLRKRMERARALEADLFISVHADSFHDKRTRGSSVYVLSERGASSEAAKWRAERENASDLIGGVSLRDKSPTLQSTLLDLSQTASLESSINAARQVLKGLGKLGNLHQQQVQSAGFLVLKSPDIPSILIETGFISNPQEEKKLASARYQDRLAQAIVTSLDQYFQNFAPPGTYYAGLASRRHVIRKGDTLSGIAEQYDVSPEQLRRHNDMQGDLLRVGQVLTIPRRG